MCVVPRGIRKPPGWGAKPEHDDVVAAAAQALGLPLRAVADRARALLAGRPAHDGTGHDHSGHDHPGDV